MSDQITTELRWLQHNPGFYSLRVGRIELAQISRGTASGHWFWSLRFCLDDEQVSFSAPTEKEARKVAEAHAKKVIA